MWVNVSLCVIQCLSCSLADARTCSDANKPTFHPFSIQPGISSSVFILLKAKLNVQFLTAESEGFVWWCVFSPGVACCVCRLSPAIPALFFSASVTPLH